MPKKIDLTGYQYGELTVIEEGPHKYGRIAWYCTCSCGKDKLLYTSNDLRMGKITSCGCKAEERHIKIGQKRKEDLTGQIFSYLTVLQDSGERMSDGSAIWECVCECGKHINVVAYSLKRGVTKSCGCKKEYLCGKDKIIDLTGQRFGKLVALEMVYLEDKKEHTFWKCKCDCGNTKIVSSRSLLNGQTQSCGCLKSKGEALIQKIFEENNISFERQKSFESCRFPNTNKPAFFDFYLPDYNLLIEYDGIQHFENTSWSNLSDNQYRDNFKNQWCKNNSIPLLRIPYLDYNLINYKYLENKINESIRT